MARRVYFDHDGGLDDYLALLLLLSYEGIELLGISVTPADTVLEGAMPATRKILDLAGRSEVAVAAGTLEGPNPFPYPWRLHCLKVNHLPVLNQREEILAPVSELPGHRFLARALLEALEPVTFLATGPLTNLAWALDHHPEVEAKVGRLLWMGGALDVDGNVRQPGHDGSAEWNVFWDPEAARRVFDSGIPITMFPLDATNAVPVTDGFRRAFGRQYAYPFSSAAGAIWALTSGWELSTGLPYFCWDTLTAAHLAEPDLCSFREVRVDVVTEGELQGRTALTEAGRPVLAAVDADADRFFAHCLEALKR